MMGNPPTKSFNTVKHSNREVRVKKRQKQRLLILAMLTVIALLVLMLMILAVCSIVSAVREDDTKAPAATPPPTAMEYEQVTRLSSYSRSLGTLLLINDRTRFSAFADAESTLVSLIPSSDDSGSPYYKISQNLKINRDALTALNKMMAVYGDESITVTTAYRSREEQDNKHQSNPDQAQPAGYSDHHSGYLIAFSESSINTSAYSLIKENCHKYGFIERYPADKKQQTGIEINYTEALRYVGIPHANYIKEHDLCLEEYIDLVRGHTVNNQLSFYSIDGQSAYSVYYVPAAQTDLTTINVPKDYQYDISGNNVDGFIVTVYLDQPIA